MMEYMLSKIVFLSLSGGAVILLVSLIQKTVGKRQSCSWNYFLWLVAMAALLMPLSWTPVGSGGQGESAAPLVAQQESAALQTEGGKTESEPTLEPVETLPKTEQPQTWGQSSQTFLQVIKRGLGHVRPALPALWLLVAAALLLRSTWRRWRFRRGMKRIAEEAAPEQSAALVQLKEQMRMQKKVRIASFYGSGSPFITGVFRPIIYLPKDLTDPQELDLVLRHELTHCKRGDLWIKWGMELIRALHFFNPLVYYMDSQIQRLCEMSCDEQVVAQMEPQSRKDYGMVILRLMKQDVFALSGSAALCEGRQHLKQRMEVIMMKREKKRFTQVISALVFAAVLLTSTALAAAVGGQNSAVAPKASYSVGDEAHAVFSFGEDSSDMIRSSVITYRNFLGRVTFEADFYAMSQETEEKIDGLLDADADPSEWNAVIEDDSSYTEKVNISLEEVTRRYDDGRALEGLFTVTVNDEVWLREQTGYLNDLPPQVSGTEETKLLIPYTKGDEMLELTLRVRLEESNGELYRESVKLKNEIYRSEDTKHLWIGTLLESTKDGEALDVTEENQALSRGAEYLGELEYNEPMGLVNYFYLPLGGGYDMSFDFLGDITVSGDTLTGKANISRRIVDTAMIVDTVEMSVTGIGGQAGDTIHITSSDGRYHIAAVIAPQVVPKTAGVGTRSPEEFYTQGEEVFIGTPHEQDEFDKKEHDRFYKRIVVDDSGRVMYVVPVEYQSHVTVNEAGSYAVTFRWPDWGGDSPIYLQDEVTHWIRAYIPLENQFFAQVD